jgi:hypothetical protein
MIGLLYSGGRQSRFASHDFLLHLYLRIQLHPLGDIFEIFLVSMLLANSNSAMFLSLSARLSLSLSLSVCLWLNVLVKSIFKTTIYKIIPRGCDWIHGHKCEKHRWLNALVKSIFKTNIYKITPRGCDWIHKHQCEKHMWLKVVGKKHVQKEYR